MMSRPSSPPPPSVLSVALPLPLLLLLLLLPPSLLSHAPLSWTSPHDPCYHPDGRPRHCLSEFINAAYGLPVRAGHSPRGSEYEGDVTALTDLHNPHNLTCWTAPGGGPGGGDWVVTLPLGRRFEITYISLQFCHQGAPSDPISISILKSMDHGQTWRPMQHYSGDCPGRFGLPPQTTAPTRQRETEPLCSDPRPLQKHRGSPVLAFSALDGRPSSPDFDYSPTLQDWVTATDIRLVFHRARGDDKRRGPEGRGDAGGGASQGTDAGLLRWRAGSQGHPGDQVNKMRVDNTLMFLERDALNTGARARSKVGKMDKQSRKAEHNVTGKERGDLFSREASAAGKKRDGRGRKKENPQWPPCPGEGCRWTVGGQNKVGGGREMRRRRNHPNAGRSRGNLQLAPPTPQPRPVPPTLALADLQVGGRCKCNGHASKCRRDDSGRAACVCEHHTAGEDCDVCEDFHFDRPWHRATPTQPNPCVACHCNGHSDQCRFSMEVFQQSGRRSGGVCQKCRHHTAGRHCQYCQDGYTRDHGKALDHRKACRPCQCHPLGAVGGWCNQTSGQCLCRDGVTGARCNRCAPGFKQGRSPLRPCIRIQEVAPTPMYQPQYSIAEECVSYCQPSQVKVRMNVDTYCLKDYVLKIHVRAMERSGPWWHFSVTVQTVYRTGPTPRVRRGPGALWVPVRDLGCGCPSLHVGRTFLLIGAEEGGAGGWGPEESRLVADRSTTALQWREHWSPKLRGFRGQDKRGRCPPKPPHRHDREPPRRGGLSDPQGGYVPPHLVAETAADARGPHNTRSAERTPGDAEGGGAGDAGDGGPASESPAEQTPTPPPGPPPTAADAAAALPKPLHATGKRRLST